MAESNDETAQAEYVFTFDVIASDREGYYSRLGNPIVFALHDETQLYYDNWDRSNRFEVIGATKHSDVCPSCQLRRRS